MEKVGFGLIGCGDIVERRVAPAIGELASCELVAVSRSRSELSPEFAKKFGARRWHKSWRDLLEDNEVDAVYIATPHDQHAEQTIAAADAGKHVLCEKPMALRTADCRAMIDACKRNNVKLGIAYYRHFYPVIHRIKEILQSGKLGAISMIQINTFEWFERASEDPRKWIYRKAESGGGPMMGAGCHRIEVLLDLLGPIRKATALMRNRVFDREVEDMGVACLEFENGAIGVLAAGNSIREPADTLDIYGSNGSARVTSLNAGELVLRIGPSESREKLPPHANLHLPLIEDFSQAIREGRAPAVGGDIGLAVQQVEAEIYGQA